jgi:hypothetical protein
MNLLIRSSLVLASVATLSSCQAVGQRAGGLLNMPMSLLQMVGRTVGLSAEAKSPAVPSSESDAVHERAKQIKQQGSFGQPMEMTTQERVAQR